MMRLPAFDLLQPESVPEVVEALVAADGKGRVCAGGTALVSMMRLGLLRPERVISLHRVSDLGQLTAAGGVLQIGAMVTLAELERNAAVRRGWPLLADAVGRVATPAIRSSATLGGNLAYAEAASDPAPALLCLEAEVHLAGPAGHRSLPVSRWFKGFYETVLEPDEIVTSIGVPPPPVGAHQGYVKFCPRSAEDKPLIGVAALVVGDPVTGRCREARLALAGAAPTPIRATRAESSLRDHQLDDDAIRAAADAAAAESDPLSDLMGSADYRREMVRVWIRRLLTELGQMTR
jgi:aerobic carbon-monoxide dehydrogenase medium subunit